MHCEYSVIWKKYKQNTLNRNSGITSLNIQRNACTDYRKSCRSDFVATINAVIVL